MVFTSVYFCDDHSPVVAHPKGKIYCQKRNSQAISAIKGCNFVYSSRHTTKDPIGLIPFNVCCVILIQTLANKEAVVPVQQNETLQALLPQKHLVPLIYRS